MLDVAVPPLNVLALCAGAGGLELGVGLATGGRARPVCYVEREAFAAADLVARMEEASLGVAPVWDDLATFDGRPWRGVVDLVTAGFPCQPNSQAGPRLGTDDERWLWPDVERVVREVGPDFVFLENVPGIFAERGGFRDVARDLALLGFDAEWGVLPASAVGATHERERVWALAYRHGRRLPLIGGEQLPRDREAPRRHDADRQGGPALVHANGGRGRKRPGSSHDARLALEPSHTGVDVADAAGSRLSDVADPGAGRVSLRQGEAEPRRCRDPLPLFPPGPDELDAWRVVLDRAPSLEPSLCRVADGMAHRVDRLHTTGNGVVPLVAAYALICLARRAGLV